LQVVFKDKVKLMNQGTAVKECQWYWLWRW